MQGGAKTKKGQRPVRNIVASSKVRAKK